MGNLGDDDRVETSDIVEDKNKNVYIITDQLKLKHIYKALVVLVSFSGYVC